MEIDTFSKILDEIKPYTDYIYLHVKGEPLLHPNIAELLDISHEKGFKVNITTNGTYLNKIKDKIMMKKAVRQINISLHSLTANDFNNKEEYVKDVLSFVKEVSEKTDIIVSLRLWNLDKDNEVNLENNLNKKLLELIEKEFDLLYKIEEKITPGFGVKLANRVFLNQDHQFQWPDLNEKEIGEVGFCYGLRDHVAILVDGTVVPCCLDGEGVINLGKINDSPFSEIIESERATKIFNGFSNRRAVEELCKKCGYRNKMDL
jgi:radical SAM protein with 4Fe4S-binding SPASM domain